MQAPNPDALLNYAISLHESGKIASANKIYQQLLKQFPKNAHLLYLLGVAECQSGRQVEGITLFSKSILLNPNDSSVHFNKGKALQELGKFDEALKSYSHSIRLDSADPTTHNNQGIVLRKLKKFDESLKASKTAIQIRPDYAEAYVNVGITLYEIEKYEEAIQFLQQSIKLNPNILEAYLYMGLVFYESGKYTEAISCYDFAIKLEPENYRIYFNKARNLIGLNLFNDALICLNYCIELNPDCVEAYSNRCSLLTELNRFDDALINSNHAIELNPSFAEAYLSKGYALAVGFRIYSDALDNYDQAIALKPEYVEANWNKSLLKLSMGKYEEGWNLYEWRWMGPQKKYARNYNQPLWLGKESLANKKILIWAEQGLGDAIQFCRYIKMVSDLGAKVIFEVQDPLLESLSTLEGAIETIPMGTQLPNFDYHCPLLSLPLAFNTLVETIPNRAPYLNSDPNKVAYWNQKLGEKINLRVGLVWSSGIHSNQPEFLNTNKKRDIPLAMLEKLNLPNIEFYSLQKGKGAVEQLTSLQNSNWNGPNIIDLTNELHDFSDTAALIDNLDLVISVDTSVVHMAGAMGKPVWVLSQFNTDWRWMDGQRESWYPTATVFNQPTHGDWDAVVGGVRSKLMGLAIQS